MEYHIMIIEYHQHSPAELHCKYAALVVLLEQIAQKIKYMNSQFSTFQIYKF